MKLTPLFIAGLLLTPSFGAEDIYYSDKAPTHEFSLKHPLICWSESRPTPLKIHYLQFDLLSKDYELVVIPSLDTDGDGPCEGSLEKPELLLTRSQAVIAVNANAFQNPTNHRDHHWFEGKPVDICGFLAHQSRPISPAEKARTSFWLDTQKTPHMGMPPSLEDVTLGVADWNHLDPKKSGALLRDGIITIRKGGGRHPRTALGYDASKRWLTLVVVDGRQKGYSQGVTLHELAKILQERGCHDAINFDGGGSSVMIAADKAALKIINKPSGKTTRPVPVMIGIRKKPSTSTPPISLKKGLQGWWSLDESEGVTAKDRSENQHGGNLLNGLDFKKNSQPGVLGQALAFDGIDDGISFSNIKISNQLTVSAWAKISNPLESGHVVSHHPGWFLSAYKGKVMRFSLRVNKREVSVPFGKTTKLDMNWHHYVGVYNGSSVKTYLDGVLVGIAPLTGNLNQEGESRIGRYSEGKDSFYRWKGLIDEVRIYSRPLSPEEIQSLFRLPNRQKNP